MNNYIINPFEKKSVSKDIVGIKSYNLYLLKKNKINVPNFIVISSELFSRLFQDVTIDVSNYILKAKSFNDIEKTQDILQKKISKIKLPDKFIIELKDNINKYFKNKNIAVRSSSSFEDFASHSFAGIFDSFLSINNIDSLLASILSVFKSVFSHRSLTYIFINKLNIKQIKMSVILQEMVDADLSGITFTIDPTNINNSDIIINYHSGLWKQIVDGNVTPNQITYNRDDSKVNVDANYDPKILSKKIILKAIKTFLKIEKYFKYIPQDIEWSIKNKKLYILQSRPISTWEEFINKKKQILWDNSNLVESYHGATTPLTFSYASKVYNMVFREFFLSMGVKTNILEQNSYLIKNLIGFIKGNIYYNLTNWYKAFKLLPGFKHNARFLESMLGVKKKLNLVDLGKDERSIKDKIFFLPSLAILIFYFIKNSIFLNRNIKIFLKQFSKIEKDVKKKNFFAMNLDEITDFYFGLENILVKLWNTPIMNDFYTMRTQGKIRKKIEKKDKKNLHVLSKLLYQNRNVESCKQIEEIIKIVSIIKDDRILFELFNNNDETYIKNILFPKPFCGEPCDIKYIKIYNIFNAFFLGYGLRCIDEMKLEVESYYENPEKLFKMIKFYLNNPEQMKDILSAQKECITKIPPSFKKLCKQINKLKRMIREREAMRLARTKTFR
ncbi:MAG: hypothetical protein KAT05_01545, partial [Spirochaetes bacterium]|nr:hypothetical protein [Spirochaetota bacterium]